MENFQIIVLAAGKGTRMESELPKALTPLSGKTFIERVLGVLKLSKSKRKPLSVVWHKKEMICEALGDNCDYVEAEPLGTGFAVLKCKEYCEKNNVSDVMILYTDHPLLSKETIDNIMTSHKDSDAVLTMATTIVPDFNDWRGGFKNFGRIVRNNSGEIEKIVEAKDANEEEMKIMELNPGYLCFKTSWLWENLAKVKNENAKGEYYLTDLVQIATEQGKKINSVKIEPVESLGANSKEELAILEKILKNGLK